MKPKTIFYCCSVLLCCSLGPIKPLLAQERPTLGFTAFTVDDFTLGQSLLTELEQRTLSRLVNNQLFKIIDRQALPELLQLREEQKNEVYLDNKPELQSIGVRYLLLVHLDKYKEGRYSMDQKMLYYHEVNIRCRILDLQTGEIVTTNNEVQKSTWGTRNKVNNYSTQLAPRLHQMLVNNVVRQIELTTGALLSGRIQIIELAFNEKEKLENALIVKQAPIRNYQVLKLYIQEEKKIKGEVLIREKTVGKIRVKNVQGRFATAKINRGKKDIIKLFQDQVPIYGK